MWLKHLALGVLIAPFVTACFSQPFQPPTADADLWEKPGASHQDVVASMLACGEHHLPVDLQIQTTSRMKIQGIPIAAADIAKAGVQFVYLGLQSGAGLLALQRGSGGFDHIIADAVDHGARQ